MERTDSAALAKLAVARRPGNTEWVNMKMGEAREYVHVWVGMR